MLKPLYIQKDITYDPDIAFLKKQACKAILLIRG